MKAIEERIKAVNSLFLKCRDIIMAKTNKLLLVILTSSDSHALMQGINVN